MKLSFNSLVLSLTKINKTHLQFVWMLITLVMLVLGAGAPNSDGGSGGGKGFGGPG
jgi:hypothetical protein